MVVPPFQVNRYPELLPFLGAEAISLADRAHDAILLQIIRGEIPAGTELKSTQLAKELEMSRTPVIKALGRLADCGIVEQTLNYRATVCDGAENWLVDLHRVRQHLEPIAARTCCGNIPEPVLHDLLQICHDAKPSKDREWQTAARWFDQALHLVIAEWCGNLSMRQILRQTWNYKRLSYEAGSDSDAHLQSGYQDHAAILEALVNVQSEEAGGLMEKHLETSAPQSPGQRIV